MNSSTADCTLRDIALEVDLWTSIGVIQGLLSKKCSEILLKLLIYLVYVNNAQRGFPASLWGAF